MKDPARKKSSLPVNPYLLIAITAFLAYLPVSAMILALKNDVLAIEYPVQHFISECLRHGESPVWFNTWAMGFPLQSILTWSIFSTPQIITGWLANSSVYVLHAEFMLFIMASGWSMYALLKKHFIPDSHFALLLSCCYMLSGFTVASSQWLLYITGMTFIPLLINVLLSLIKRPALWQAFLFAVCYYLLLTNVHIYITLVATYVLAFFLLFVFIKKIITSGKGNRKETISLFGFIMLAGFFSAILCASPVYYTLELMSYLNRSHPLIHNPSFFQSNYLHPQALSSLWLPLSSVRTAFTNTEGTLLNSYIGLVPILLFPVSLVRILKQKNAVAVTLLLLAAFFLLVSFGHLTPLRNGLNIFPGFSFFRNPGVLRFFFILFFILYLAAVFRQEAFMDLLQKKTRERKIILVTTGITFILFLLILTLNVPATDGLLKNSFYQILKQAGAKELTGINSLIQVFVTGILLLAIFKKSNLVIFIALAELAVNTLICTPYFTTGTYTVKEVNELLQSPDGFPVQQPSPGNVAATFTDKRGNSWHNINTFKKQVSNQVSMTGPLFLAGVYRFLEQPALRKSLLSKGLLFVSDSSFSIDDSILIIRQKPNEVTARVSLSREKEITLQQSYFPGWKAYYNNAAIPLTKDKSPLLHARLPAGTGMVSFIFKKNMPLITAIILHSIIMLTLLYQMARIFKPKAASPS